MNKKSKFNFEKFDSRLFKLEQFIEINNKKTDWFPADTELPEGVSEAFTQMLVYDGTKGRQSVFAEIMELDREYEVHLTDRIKDYMIPGDLFMMTLGKFKNQWKILFCSPPYLVESF